MSLVSPLLQPSRELSGLTVFTRPPISKIFVKKYSLLPFDAKTQRIHGKSTKEIEMVQGFLLRLLHPFLTIPVGNQKGSFLSSFQYFLKNKSFTGVKRVYRHPLTGFVYRCCKKVELLPVICWSLRRAFDIHYKILHVTYKVTPHQLYEYLILQNGFYSQPLCFHTMLFT